MRDLCDSLESTYCIIDRMLCDNSMLMDLPQALGSLQGSVLDAQTILFLDHVPAESFETETQHSIICQVVGDRPEDCCTAPSVAPTWSKRSLCNNNIFCT